MISQSKLYSIIDASTKSSVNDILYFDDVSIKLHSSKTLVLLFYKNKITANISNVDSKFSLATVNANELVTHKSLTSSSTITTIINGVTYFVHKFILVASNDTAGSFNDDVEFTLDNITLKLKLVCEFIDENDRYAIALANNKFFITDEFLKAFKESNVNEVYTDYDILNTKRKELLLDLFSIKSFTGLYSGLIAALKYFGYDDDVFIKEFWTYLDSTLNEYVISPRNIESDVSTLPKGYTKTNMFSLTYRLNDVSGFYGPDDLPEVIAIFSNEIDALVKIHNMRLVLELYFMPAHAVIVDVIGEHLNFNYSTIAYYMHNAITHYYDTELTSLFKIDEQPLHETTSVILPERLDSGIIINESVVAIQKFASLDELDDNKFTYYVDNFAHVTISLEQQYLSNCLYYDIIILDSSKNVVYSKFYVNENSIIGLLNADDYEINLIATDKYNVRHIHKHSIETKFVPHDFDIFTHKNALNFKEPIKRNVFKSTKEAFEYFDYYDNAKAKLSDILKDRYEMLPVIEAYSSITKTTEYVPKYSLYSDSNSYNTLDRYIQLPPYRFFTDAVTIANDFMLNVDRYADMHDELKQYYNKAYVSIQIILRNGRNDFNFVINGKRTRLAVTLDLNSPDWQKTLLTYFYTQKKANAAMLGELKHYDCFAYHGTAESGSNTPGFAVCNFMSTSAVDITEFTTDIDTTAYTDDNTPGTTTISFKNVISHQGAFNWVYIAQDPLVVLNTPIELIVNGVNYSTMYTGAITNADELIEAIDQLIDSHRALQDIKLEVFRISDKVCFINSNESFVLSTQSVGVVGGGNRLHIINDLIKLRPGDDIKKYSIVFAKINENSKSRPHNIKWILTEHSGNESNIVKESTDYFFNTILTAKTAYSLELQYKDHHGATTTKSITKHGVFLVGDEYVKQIDDFLESNLYSDL